MFRITRTGYGVGHRDAEIPNLLRVHLGERDRAPTSGAGGPGGRAEGHEGGGPGGRAAGADAGARGGRAAPLPRLEAAVLVECNVDDMSPELHGHLIDRLLGAGAVDAWLTPIVMKKSRAAVALSALCPPEAEAAVTEIFFRETTTFGVRRSDVSKRPLRRELRTVATSLGEIGVKTAYLGGEAIKSKLEYEDLRRIAEERGMPLRDVEAAARRELEEP
jgi:uncharacterized protein (DUF111 family)